MTQDDIKNTVRSFVLGKFLPGEPPGALEDSTQLITSGVIPSLSLVELVNFIEHEYQITLEDEDIGAMHMDSVDLMASMIERHIGVAVEPGSRR